MNRIFVALALVMAIPMIGLVSGGYAKHKYERIFSTALERSVDHDEAARELHARNYTFANYCADMRRSTNAARTDVIACRDWRTGSWLRIGSLIALLLGLGLLGGILYASHAAMRDREKLLKLFGPGIRVVLFGLFTLTLLQGLILSFSFLIIEGALIQRTSWVLAALLMLGILVSAVYMLQAGLSVFRRAETAVVGVALFKKDQPLLWNFVERIAKRLDASPPRNIVVGLEPTFYATSADVRVLPKGFPQREETLYLSLPLMRIFTMPELAAVIGHELGHFRGDDTRFSKEFYPVYAGSAHALDSLHQSADDLGVVQASALWPAIWMLTLFFDRFAEVENAIGRTRELEADRCGAAVSSPLAIATTLLKLTVYAHHWDDIQAQLADQRLSAPLKNASAEFARRTHTAKIDADILEDMANHIIPHPTDRHPPSAQRIKALGISIPQMKTLDLSVDPAAASTRLVMGLEAIEESLTVLEQRMLREQADTYGAG